jgi:hypothetical protein
MALAQILERGVRYVHIAEPMLYDAADQLVESRIAKFEAARSKGRRGM